MTIVSAWRVEHQFAWKTGAEKKSIYRVLRDVEYVNTYGRDVKSVEYLKNGKTERFTKAETAQAACDRANAA